jgi:putative oxidoreductase
MTFWTGALWLGKLLFCVFYFLSGLKHLTQMKQVVAYGAARQLPLPQVLVPLSGLMLMAGSLMFLLRWHQIWGLGLLALFLVAAAVLIHKYWVESDPAQRGNQRNHFWKNVTLAASCLLLAVAIQRGGPL